MNTLPALLAGSCCALAAAITPASAFAQAAPAAPAPTPPAAKPATTPSTQAPGTQAPSTQPPKPYDAAVARVHAALDAWGAGGEPATTVVNNAWDWACVNLPADQPATFLELATARRMVEAVSAYKGDRPALVRFLRSSPNLSKALLFQMTGGEGDRPEAVIGVLDNLRKVFTQAQLEQFATLTAAICVVYDQPVVKFINENSASGVSAEDAFRYYSTFAGRMVYSPARMPADLLVYMVDPAATLDEYAWAAGKYAGRREVGPLYSEIVYDQDHFTSGAQKKLTKEGFNLPNIKKYGGICADQAHYASTVGKVVGVPAVVTTGKGSGVGHAWLGYLRRNGGSLEWDFRTGRYTEYETIRGTITDPQTGGQIPDGTLALTAESLDVPDTARFASTALADAAARLGKGTQGSLSGAEVTGPLAARKGTTAEKLDLLKASVNLYPANHRAWNVVRSMATAGDLNAEQKAQWAEAVQRLCGNKYPDFTLAVLIPMVSTMSDVAQQGAIWERLYKKMRPNRPDLAAEVLIAQGKMWDRANHPDRALESFTTAAKEFIQKSQAAVEALQECEAMLTKRNVPAAAIGLYADVWRRIGQPDDMAQEFRRQSNWYRVGARYAELLQAAGDTRKAEQILRTLGEDQASVNRRERQAERQNRRDSR